MTRSPSVQSIQLDKPRPGCAQPRLLARDNLARIITNSMVLSSPNDEPIYARIIRQSIQLILPQLSRVERVVAVVLRPHVWPHRQGVINLLDFVKDRRKTGIPRRKAAGKGIGRREEGVVAVVCYETAVVAVQGGQGVAGEPVPANDLVRGDHVCGPCL